MNSNSPKVKHFELELKFIPSLVVSTRSTAYTVLISIWIQLICKGRFHKLYYLQSQARFLISSGSTQIWLIFWGVNVYSNAELLKSETSYFEKCKQVHRPRILLYCIILFQSTNRSIKNYLKQSENIFQRSHRHEKFSWKYTSAVVHSWQLGIWFPLKVARQQPPNKLII